MKIINIQIFLWIVERFYRVGTQTVFLSSSDLNERWRCRTLLYVLFYIYIFSLLILFRVCTDIVLITSKRRLGMYGPYLYQL